MLPWDTYYDQGECRGKALRGDPHTYFQISLKTSVLPQHVYVAKSPENFRQQI